jgi:glycosyl hydrolase family 109 protein 2
VKEQHSLSHAYSPLPHVRLGIIGLGQRGLRTIQRYRHIEGATIVALSDIYPERIQEAQTLLSSLGCPEAKGYSREQIPEMLASGEVDLVLICTDWYSHVPLACATMEAGLHVAVEVPAALTLEDCWRLVETSERMGRHYFPLENCCFDPFHLRTLALVAKGELGRVKHCSGGYIHDLHSLSDLGQEEIPLLGWMDEGYPFAAGNAYPTHGLGPMAQLLDIHHGDRFTELYAISSDPDAPLSERISTILLRTEQGRTASLHLDLHTPRPYSRLQSLSGSEGFLCKYPSPTLQLRGWSEALIGDEVEDYLTREACSPLESWIQEGKDKGVKNVMNYVMDARLIHCLRHGQPLDLTVYDAALWSSVIELSARSESERRPVEIPDFTRGLWRKSSIYLEE